MNQTENESLALGVTDTLTQMVRVLGFHDLASFIFASVMVIAFASLLIGGVIAIVKKRRERLIELTKIVHEVQGEYQPAQPASEEPPTQVAPEPVATKVPSKEIARPQPQPVVAKKAPPPVAEKPERVKPPAPPALARKIPEPTPVVETRKPTPVAQPVVEAPRPAPVAPPEAEKVEPVAVPPKAEPEKGLGSALEKTRGGFMEKLSRLFSRKSEVSDADFEELEAILFTADIGAKTAQKLLDVMRERAKKEKAPTKDFLRGILKEEMTRILESATFEPKEDASSPQVLMFVGVNGAGKTTSIGKLGAQLANAGKKVMFGAGDTFRAAAVEQLTIWGQRVGAEVISGKENSDSAAVLFEAIEKAKANHVDYVLCDTAGRLHTKTSLMDELKKVHRVVSKAQTGAPHQVYLVIDATMGQNAINQAREFLSATPLTGVVLSKLDGTAKGGVALGIVDELKVPIRYIGIGERVSDLKDFDAKLFVDALFEEA